MVGRRASVDLVVAPTTDRRDGEDVVARCTGETIEGDPRWVAFAITVEEMVDLVTDERLTLG